MKSSIKIFGFVAFAAIACGAFALTLLWDSEPAPQPQSSSAGVSGQVAAGSHEHPILSGFNEGDDTNTGGLIIPQEWQQLLDANPDAALTKANEIARTTGDRTMLRMAARYLLGKSFSHAPLVSRILNNSMEFQGILSDFIPDAVKKDPDGMVGIANKIVGEDKNHALRLIGREFLRGGDLSRAMALQEQMPFGADKESIVSGIMDLAARQNPARAFELLPRLDKARELQTAIERMQLVFVQKKSEQDLKTLLGYAEKPRTRESIIKSLGFLMQQRGDSLSLEQLKLGLAPRERDLLTGIALKPDATFKEAVAEFEKISDEYVRKERVNSFVSRKTSADPEKAAAEVMALSDRDFKSGLLGLTQTWVRMDSEQMSEWVQKLPPGPRRDIVIREFAGWMNRIDHSLTPTIISWHQSEKERETTRKMFPR